MTDTDVAMVGGGAAGGQGAGQEDHTEGQLLSHFDLVYLPESKGHFPLGSGHVCWRQNRKDKIIKINKINS